jgi:hypothetical protein
MRDSTCIVFAKSIDPIKQNVQNYRLTAEKIGSDLTAEKH